MGLVPCLKTAVNTLMQPGPANKEEKISCCLYHSRLIFNVPPTQPWMQKTTTSGEGTQPSPLPANPFFLNSGASLFTPAPLSPLQPDYRREKLPYTVRCHLLELALLPLSLGFIKLCSSGKGGDACQVKRRKAGGENRGRGLVLAASPTQAEKEESASLRQEGRDAGQVPHSGEAVRGGKEPPLPPP